MTDDGVSQAFGSRDPCRAHPIPTDDVVDVPATIAGPATPERPPLVALLGHAHDAFAAEFDALLADTEFADVSLAHFRNVLRHLEAGPLRSSQIVGRCGVTKQAVSQQLAHLHTRGYVSLTPDPLDGRARLVALTEKGCRARARVHSLFAEIEGRWARVLGDDDVALRRALLTILAARAQRS